MHECSRLFPQECVVSKDIFESRRFRVFLVEKHFRENRTKSGRSAQDGLQPDECAQRECLMSHNMTVHYHDLEK